MGLSVGLGNVTQVPAGIISAFAGVAAPAGWLMCFGQAVSRTEYAGLFTALSTTYGVGDGSTTFNIPDLRGRAIAGVDNMGGSDAGRLSIANTLGTATGSETVTLTAAQSGVPAHSHGNSLTGTTSFASTAHTHTVTTGYTSGFIAFNGSAYTNGGSVATNPPQSGTPSATASVGISNANNTAADAASAHSNMQPTIVLNYIIKATQ
jgi:microcystin-dependent protein